MAEESGSPMRRPAGAVALILFVTALTGLMAILGREIERYHAVDDVTADAARAFTWDLAVADVTGDGRPEIAIGAYHGRNRVVAYRDGRARTLWRGAQDSLTAGVAFGALVGDAQPDLVVANFAAPNRVYRRRGEAAFGECWHSAPTAKTYALATGDVDGDGDDDLLAGNRGRNRVYRALASDALRLAWTGARKAPTFGLAVADSDDDRAVDLIAFGNYSAPNRVYRVSDQGEPPLVWRSRHKRITYALALADVTGDGRMDLICGNSGRNCLYRGRPGRSFARVAGAFR